MTRAQSPAQSTCTGRERKGLGGGGGGAEEAAPSRPLKDWKGKGEVPCGGVLGAAVPCGAQEHHRGPSQAMPRGRPTTRPAPGPRGRSFSAHCEDVLEMGGISQFAGSRRFPTASALPKASSWRARPSRWEAAGLQSLQRAELRGLTNSQCGAPREECVRSAGPPRPVCEGQATGQPEDRGPGAWLPRLSVCGKGPPALGPYFGYVPFHWIILPNV